VGAAAVEAAAGTAEAEGLGGALSLLAVLLQAPAKSALAIKPTVRTVFP
jgi:hypothetical protein